MDYQRKDKNWFDLHYNQFIGSTSEEHLLTVGGFTVAGNKWFNYIVLIHTGMKFSTLDNDNDSSGNSVVNYESGWW